MKYVLALELLLFFATQTNPSFVVLVESKTLGKLGHQLGVNAYLRVKTDPCSGLKKSLLGFVGVYAVGCGRWAEGPRGDLPLRPLLHYFALPARDQKLGAGFGQSSLMLCFGLCVLISALF